MPPLRKLNSPFLPSPVLEHTQISPLLQYSPSRLWPYRGSNACQIFPGHNIVLTGTDFDYYQCWQRSCARAYYLFTTINWEQR